MKGEVAIQLYPSMLATFVDETWSGKLTAVVELVFLQIAFWHTCVDWRENEPEPVVLSERLPNDLVQILEVDVDFVVAWSPEGSPGGDAIVPDLLLLTLLLEKLEGFLFNLQVVICKRRHCLGDTNVSRADSDYSSQSRPLPNWSDWC